MFGLVYNCPGWISGKCSVVEVNDQIEFKCMTHVGNSKFEWESATAWQGRKANAIWYCSSIAPFLCTNADFSVQETRGRCRLIPISMRHAMLSSNAVCMPVNHSSRNTPPIARRTTTSSKARWIYPLTDPRPLGQLCKHHQVSHDILGLVYRSPENDDLLWIPFRYRFSFRSNIVYLSFGLISASVGISSFHLSSFVVDSRLCFLRALSTVVTTLSTRRRRLR